MDVKACDDCKKLNTEKPLLRLFEKRMWATEGTMKELIADKTGSLTGFSIYLDADDQIKGQAALLCFDCLRKRAPVLIDELLPHLSRAAVQSQQNQQ